MPITGPRIELTFSPKGEVATHVEGIVGGQCRALTAGWESLFGEVIETTDTAEAYEDEHEVEIKTQQQD